MANDNQTYAEQVAAFRAQKRQQELTADYNQAIYGREEAACRGSQTARLLAVALVRCNGATCHQETPARGR